MLHFAFHHALHRRMKEFSIMAPYTQAEPKQIRLPSNAKLGVLRALFVLHPHPRCRGGRRDDSPTPKWSEKITVLDVKIQSSTFNHNPSTLMRPPFINIVPLPHNVHSDHRFARPRGGVGCYTLWPESGKPRSVSPKRQKSSAAWPQFKKQCVSFSVQFLLAVVGAKGTTHFRRSCKTHTRLF